MKLRLVVMDGPLAGREFEVREGAVWLGGAPECPISLGGAEGVAPQHAYVQPAPDGFHLVDYQSPTGTYVNGQRISNVVLKPGDVIQLGMPGPQLRAAIEADAPAAQARPAGPQQAPAAGPTVQAGAAPSQAARDAAARAAAAQEAAGRAAAAGMAAAQAVFERMGPDRERNILTLGLSVAFVAWMLLVVFAVTVWQVGIVGGLVGWILAFLPIPILLLVFLVVDSYDWEPPWALLAAFAWGALFSLAVSFFVNSVLKNVLVSLFGDGAGRVTPILCAPPVEEGTKGLGIVLLYFLLRREFDGVVDGIVYGGIIALGFAAQENVLYYGREFNKGEGGLMWVVFLRGVLGPFSHSFFTAMTGAGLGLARESRNRMVKLVAPIGGYCLAMFLHMTWNGLASLMPDDTAYIIAYFVVWVPLFLMFVAVLFYLVRREGKAIRTMLDEEAAEGVVTAEQVNLISSLPQRLRWLASCVSDQKKLRARLGFLRSATKLALCRAEVQKAKEAGQSSSCEELMPAYKARLTALSAEI